MPGTFTFRQVLGVREELRAWYPRGVSRPKAPRGFDTGMLEDGWAFLRAAELEASGCQARVLRLRGQAPVVCYRLEGALEGAMV